MHFEGVGVGFKGFGGIEVLVSVGQKVNDGDPVMIIEAMKMEIPVKAPKAGIIAKVEVAQGDAVARGDTLIALEED